MILSIVFAVLWGVIQLIVLGSFARTVRVRTVVMAIAVGLFACAPLALLLQVAWTSSAAWLTESSLYLLVKTAGYTADPFIEEIVKVLPVAALLTIPAIRRQWSITDCVLLGAAGGAGFGLAEDLFRFGTASASALWNASYGGWWLPGIVNPTVPSPWTTVTSWLPPGVFPNDLITLSANDYPAVNLHLAWSAVGGLAVGLILLRQAKISKIAGAILLLYIAGDHAAYNARLSDESSVMRNLLAFMPIVALGVAWWLDRRSQRSRDGVEPVLPAEEDASPRFVGTLRAAVSRVPWSVPWVYGLVRLRRAYNSAGACQYSEERQALGAVLVDARDRVQRNLVQLESPRWLPNAWTRSYLLAALRRPTVILWLVLVTPPILWFVVGGLPQTAAVQKMMTGPVAWKAVVVLSIVSQVWLARVMILAIRAWPQALHFTLGEDTAIAGLRIVQGVGAAAFGAYCLLRIGTGFSPAKDLYSPHASEAFQAVTTAAGLLLADLGSVLGAIAAGVSMGARLPDWLTHGAAGLLFGAMQGILPGGFAIPSPHPKDTNFEAGRGVGQLLAGIADVLLGGGAEVGGVVLDATGVGAAIGIPANVVGGVLIANGVASAAAGAITIAKSGVLSSTGAGGQGTGGDSSGGQGSEPPVKKGPIPNEEPASVQEAMALREAQGGAGTVEIENSKLGDVPRLEANYGQGDWVKMQHTHKTPDGRNISIHWFRNQSTGQDVEFKFARGEVLNPLNQPRRNF